MKSSEIRKKFLEFFSSRGHAVVPSSSLIPDDPSVLLTTAGVQQFKPYYTGEADPLVSIHQSIDAPLGSKNAVSIQKCFRTSDIDEVGDERHLTFFEMLGNFSFGGDARVPCEAGTPVCGYFKKEAIAYAHEFITKELGLTISYVTVFEGLDAIGVPEDTASQEIWKSIDPNIKIIKQGMEDVFWGPTGSAGPCGPTTEIYCKNEAMDEPVEIWNIVFNEFFFPGSREELLSGAAGKTLERLKTPGVDTGMGLERLAMVAQGKKNIFETDLFLEIAALLSNELSEITKRIIIDHLRASTFLLADGVQHSNKDRGSILRRLMRRVFEYETNNSFNKIIKGIIQEYGKFYIELLKNEEMILKELELERERFFVANKAATEAIVRVFIGKSKDEESRHKLVQLLSELVKDKKKRLSLDQPIERGKPIQMIDYQDLIDATTISGKEAFDLYQTTGASLELITKIARTYFNRDVDEKDFWEEFKKHQEISRVGATAKFGGHGLYLKTGEVTIRDESEVERVTRLHTATHLLHAALRAVLGSEVRQDGSDITVERTRFDFKFGRKVLPDELKKVEEWVNDAIRRDLKVEWEETTYEEAVKKGALGFFREKYPPRVKVYSMIDPATGEVRSREFCGGPHVQHTAEIGVFKITKEESSSAGVRRIRGVVE